MNPTEVVEKAYKLIYLVDNPNAVPDAVIILADDWKKYMREIIYGIILMVHFYKVYRNIKDILTLDGIKLLYALDKDEYDEKELLKKFIKLVHMYVSYSLNNKLDLKYNKERWNTIYNALNEFDSLIKKWD